MQISIYGNSGSGKSTLARSLRDQFGIPHLDLDLIYWTGGSDPSPRPIAAVVSDLSSFFSKNRSWVVEGCYTQLIEYTLAWHPLLIFLDPGEAICLENCKARPFEPHKFRSSDEQAARLEFLLRWVSEYFTRDDEISFEAHINLFTGYRGKKLRVRGRFDLNDSSVWSQQIGLALGDPSRNSSGNQFDSLLPRDVSVDIRPFEEKDRASLRVLYVESRDVAFSWVASGVHLTSDFDSATDGEKILVAEVGGVICGFASVWEPERFLHNLFVSPRFWRKGVGKALLSHALKCCGGSGRLKCLKQNTHARVFYESQGWIVLKEELGPEGPYLLMGNRIE